MYSLNKPKLSACFRKALICCLCWLVKWPAQTEIAYVMHESISAVNTVCSCMGGKPRLFNSFNRYILWERTVNTKFTWSSKPSLSLKKTHSKEFSNMFLDNTIKCTRHIKLGMWSMENQLCLSYINAHFALLGPVANMSKLESGCFQYAQEPVSSCHRHILSRY